MLSVQFNHHQALLSGLDSNKNNKLEELQVSTELKAKIDSNQDGELALAEVSSAMQADQIDIQGTQIVTALRKDIQIVGLDRMQNIHTILERALSALHVWAPRVSDNIDAAGELIGALAGVKDERSYTERRADENRRLNHSSTAYLMAVRKRC